MLELIRIARSGPAEGVYPRLQEYGNVLQGVVIELDPYWQFMWHATRLFSDHPLIEEAQEWVNSQSTEFPYSIYDMTSVVPVSGELTFDYSPPGWRSYCAPRGLDPEQPPVRISVRVRPEADIIGIADALADTPVPVALSVRPLARFASGTLLVSGSRQNQPRTIGGRSFSSSFGEVAITCGHGLEVGDPIFAPPPLHAWNTTLVGTCLQVELPPPVPEGRRCNPWLGDEREVDLAVVTADDESSDILPFVDAESVLPRSSIAPGATVSGYLGTSHHSVSLELGGLGATYTFLDQSGIEHCLSNLVVLRWPRLGRVRGSPIRGGDSGSWLFSETTHGSKLSLMACGSDQVEGFATLADATMTRLR